MSLASWQPRWVAKVFPQEQKLEGPRAGKADKTCSISVHQLLFQTIQRFRRLVQGFVKLRKAKYDVNASPPPNFFSSRRQKGRDVQSNFANRIQCVWDHHSSHPPDPVLYSGLVDYILRHYCYHLLHRVSYIPTGAVVCLYGVAFVWQCPLLVPWLLT